MPVCAYNFPRWAYSPEQIYLNRTMTCSITGGRTLTIAADAIDPNVFRAADVGFSVVGAGIPAGTAIASVAADPGKIATLGTTCTNSGSLSVTETKGTAVARTNQQIWDQTSTDFGGGNYTTNKPAVPGKNGLPGAVQWFNFQLGYTGGHVSAFPTAVCESSWSQGAVPMLVWQPTDDVLNPYPNNPLYGFMHQGAGNPLDGVATTWAKGAAAWGKPCTLRPWRELTGDWYNWGMGYLADRPWVSPPSGQTDPDTGAHYKLAKAQQLFVAAWRRLYNIVHPIAPNVQFMFNPTAAPVPPTGGPTNDWSGAVTTGTDPSNLPNGAYPGNGFVDWLAIDHYYNNLTWAKAVDPCYNAINRVCASARPVCVTEVGISAPAGTPGPWVQAMLNYILSNQARITHVNYFNGGDAAGPKYNIENGVGGPPTNDQKAIVAAFNNVPWSPSPLPTWYNAAGIPGWASSWGGTPVVTGSGHAGPPPQVASGWAWGSGTPTATGGASPTTHYAAAYG